MRKTKKKLVGNFSALDNFAKQLYEYTVYCFDIDNNGAFCSNGETVYSPLPSMSKNCSATAKDEPGRLPVITSPADFRAKGVSMAEWAKERGFNVRLVYAVARGERKSLRGQSFQIASELGMK